MKLHNLFAIAAASTTLLFAGAGCSSQADDASVGSGEQNQTNADAPVARFAPHLKSLRGALESGQPVDQIAQTLLGSGRPAAFALQALCRLYEKEDDATFKTMRDDFKALEDGIGQYDKWYTFYQAAVSQGKDKATIDRLKAQADSALKTFSTMLTSRGFINAEDAKKPGLVGKHEEWLKAYKWKSRNEDREVILKHLSKELEDLVETKYDMKILEHGDGVHELRRDIRWILIEQLQVGGMITLKDAKTCAIPAYASLPLTDRYAQLRSSALEPNPCQVDGCVVAATARAVNNLGDLKDQAEIELNINPGLGDVTPERLQKPAQDLYDDILKNKLFETYKAQIDTCRDALKVAPPANPEGGADAGPDAPPEK